ncbi:MAG TPA: EamA family transporter [Actinomycetota bacterium]|nr:EamA family transporter [Actinomycetota bacterium]
MARPSVQTIAGDGRGAEHSDWRIWVALGILYFVWGSTYFAIKEAIGSIPPFLMAAARFLVAGGLLFAVAVRRGDRAADRPGPRQWLAAAVVGGALLTVANSGVVLAEDRGVATGIVALIVATVPLWMAIIDRVVTGQRLRPPVVAGLLVGFAGLALLVLRGGGRVDPVGTAIVVIASFSWAAGSVYARQAPLPKRPLVGSGMEMLCGGALMVVVGLATGELHDLNPSDITATSVLGLAYLIVFGSVVAFSAYVWLLHRARLSLVSTYAYVNPVIAAFLGWAFLSEPITARTMVASAIIVVGVALIVTTRSAEPAVPPPSDAVPIDAREAQDREA